MVKNVELPDDRWSINPWYGETLWTLEWKGQGAVTIDIKARCFRGGLGTNSGPIESKKRYVGRGWKQAIVDDAVKFLEGIYKDGL